jgi:hypothetical protein
MHIYSPKELYKLKDKATTLFKETNFNAYDSDLQHIVCILLTFVADYEARTGQQLDFKLESRQAHSSVDDL